MKPNIKPILARIIASGGRCAFIIRKKYYNKYGLKLGQEIEVRIDNKYKVIFPAKIVQVGTNAGIYFPPRFMRRYKIQPTEEAIKIRLDIADLKQFNIHRKKSANPGIKPRLEIKQTSQKGCDPNELQLSA